MTSSSSEVRIGVGSVVALIFLPLLLIFSLTSLFVGTTMDDVDWLGMLNGTTYEATAQAVNKGWLQSFSTGLTLMLFGLVAFADVDVKQMWCILLIFVLGGVVGFASYVQLVTKAFSLTSLVGSWQSTAFPDQVTDIELVFAHHFNSRFCGIQPHYFCDRASLNEVLKLNFGRAMRTNAVTSSVHSEELIEACLDRYGFNITEESLTWGYMCDYCVKSDQFEESEGFYFYNWTRDNCDHNAQTLSWCAVSLNATDTGSIVTNSPFAVCREPLLDHMRYWSRTFGGVVLGSAICLFVVLAVSFPLLCYNAPCHCSRQRRHGTTQPEDEEAIKGLKAAESPAFSSGNVPIQQIKLSSLAEGSTEVKGSTDRMA